VATSSPLVLRGGRAPSSRGGRWVGQAKIRGLLARVVCGRTEEGSLSLLTYKLVLTFLKGVGSRRSLGSTPGIVRCPALGWGSAHLEHRPASVHAHWALAATHWKFQCSVMLWRNWSSSGCAHPTTLFAGFLCTGVRQQDGRERGGAGSADRSIDGRVPAGMRSLAKRRQISDSVSGRNGLHDPHQLNAPTRKSAAQCCWVVCTMAQRAFRMVRFGGCSRSLASGALPR